MSSHSTAPIACVVVVVVLLAALAGCSRSQAADDRPVWNDVTPTTSGTAVPAKVTLPSGSDDPGPTVEPPGQTPVTIPEEGAPSTTAAPAPATTGPRADPTPTAAPAGFAELETRLGGTLGFAWVPVGGGKVTSGGRWSSGVAWSTAKVPVAVAAVRAGEPVDANMRASITASNNEAAEAVWRSLGSADRAASATTAVLRSGGDGATTVPSNRLRAGYTVFGQTQWRLADQAQFASRLPCIQGSEPVLGLMGQVVADQRWGLGATGLQARFKGGWGPSGTTGYEVRQFGVVTLRDGSRVGIAIASAPADGSLATGSRNLSAVAQWLTTSGGLSGGRC